MSVLVPHAPVTTETLQDDGLNNNELAGGLLQRIEEQKGNAKLDLSLANVSTVPLDTIRVYYGQPLSLDLSFNLINRLDSKFVQQMVTLRKLDLGRNNLKKLPDDFGKLEQLEFLDVRQNMLEQLPLSMGRLRRLYYLNISENPFRPPLSNFLKLEVIKEDFENNAGNVAQPVLHFLRDLVNRSAQAAGGDGPPEILLPMDRKRSVTFDSPTTRRDRVTINELFQDDVLMEDERFNDFQMRSDYERDFKMMRSTVRDNSGVTVVTSGQQLQDSDQVKGRMKAIGLLCLMVLMTPLLVSFMVGSSFFDTLAQKYTGYFATFWSFYRPIHQMAEYLCCGLRIRSPIFVSGPTPVVEETFVSAIIRTFADMFMFIVNMFK